MKTGHNDPDTGVAHDKTQNFVALPTTHTTADRDRASLPRQARLPINRCSLPAVLLGSLAYQKRPVALALDGVLELHKPLFMALDRLADPAERARLFQNHMAAAFSLDSPEEAGWRDNARHARAKAHYLRLLRGWAFDSDGQEGAVLKGWVESCFGLLPRHHGGPIRDFSALPYRAYLEQRSRGLYGTNALEAQLDLLYTYCQYELGRQRLGQTHITLYRGVNHMGDHETLYEMAHPADNLRDKPRRVVLLNSLSSFTRNRERAGEFGDFILEVEVPLAKVAFFHGLLPGRLAGEDEYAVIGGVYEVEYATT
ncbi:MAG: NAD(+)--dinitrogen-reductase ADP-D-ribosyltransferase [Pseudomonadota bacterium]